MSKFIGQQAAIIGALALGVAGLFSAPADARVDKEWCAGDVAVPSTYFGDPDDPRTMILSRGPTGSREMWGYIRVSQADGLRWYCRTADGWVRERAHCEEDGERHRYVEVVLRSDDALRVYC